MANKRKKTTAIVAGVTAAALLLGGTFAWTSISQMALNESAGIVNVGGRLHDDFNGKNKDVYVENFTDPLNGGQPIYARVRLDEYMEVGKDAGGVDVDGDDIIDAVPVINDTNRDDVTTWKPHVPSDSCAVCESGDTCAIHDHWEWVMGGQTTFMPTFNKDKDSLAADINGTYAGTNPDDKVYYDDYVTYATEGGSTVDMADATFTAPEGATNATPLTEAEGNVTTVIGTEIYDDDTDTADNGGTRQVAGVTHTAKQTATAEVMTMQEWIDGGRLPGNYWVYDTDGWAYWANPIMPGEATGLLLSNINMYKNPGEKCYYAINVVGQFATVNDWEYFYNENDEFDGTEDALNLLTTASQNVATVTVNNVSGETLLTPGESYEFSANVTVNGVQVLAADDFEWSVLNADLSTAKSTITDGMLTVADGETAKNLIVVAKSKGPEYLGALGMTSVAVEIKDFKIAVLPKTMNDDEGGTYEEAWPGYMDDNSSWTMQLMVGDAPITEGVTWSSELIASNPTDNEFLEGTGIDATTGVFTVAEGEVTWQSGQYQSNAWHVVEVTASVEGEEPVKERFYLGAYFGVEGLKFYEAGTTNAVSQYSLVVNTEYDTRIRMWDQNTYTDTMTDYMNPISFEGATVTVTDREGNVTDKATWVDGKFVATEAGEYIVNLTKEDAVYGTINGYDYITVNRVDPELLPIINEIAATEAVGSTASGGTGADIYINGENLPMVTIDGEQYFVVVKDETPGAERALLLSKDEYDFPVVEDLNEYGYDTATYTKYGNSTKWADSDVYALLNSTEPVTIKTAGYYNYTEVFDVKVTSFLTNNTTVAKIAIPTEISTRVYDEDGNYTYETTTSKVFTMSEADVDGTIGGVATDNTEDYTYVLDGQGIDLFEHTLGGATIGGTKVSYCFTWLRSAYSAETVGQLNFYGTVFGNYPQGGVTSNNGTYLNGWVHPMFWADISAADIYTAE